MPDHDKIWLTSMDPFLPKFCPKWPSPVDLSVGDIRRQIAAEWLETEMHRARPTSRPVLHHPVNSEYDKRYRHDIISQAMAPFSKLLWPLFPLNYNFLFGNGMPCIKSRGFR